ncbi:uncharacterized protein LOC135685663 isoform X1 [Rhopilema esculentum]|uniref:uncharacterized protein LOC135685663 isoform X1 n=2 Tax=Rhopilema esculentum TaxID=499914 RepID=UPI0031DDC25F
MARMMSHVSSRNSIGPRREEKSWIILFSEWIQKLSLQSDTSFSRALKLRMNQESGERSLNEMSESSNSPGRQTHLISRFKVPNPNGPNMAEYVYEDLSAMNPSLRETWLSEQCASFENENKNYFYVEKETYIESLYKYLRKVTKRWSSWNHKSFGPITSRDQIRELLKWERSRGFRHHSGHNRNRGTSSSSEQDIEANPLEKFETFCSCSENLLLVFKRDIYKPLTEYFLDSNTKVTLQEIPENLASCISKWETLLESKEIDDKLFSKESEKEIFMNGLRNRTSENDLVLRLVPDLFEKHVEALKLARRWRLIVRASDIKRRGTFTVAMPQAVKLLKRREEIQRSMRTRSRRKNSMESNANSSDAESHNNEEAQERYRKVLNELEDTKATCLLYEDEISVYKEDYDQMRRELSSVKDTCKELHAKITEPRLQDRIESPEVEESSAEYCRVLKKELDHTKMKYCSQRIKLMNAKKRVENLNMQLTQAQQKYGQLEDEMQGARGKYGKLEDQLTISRRNLQTQGSMIDALQHQCKTLYDELEKTNERCKTMEGDLTLSKKRCKDLEHDVHRRISREEELEKENRFLREKHIKGKERKQAAKTECMFPEINRGRSS